MNITQCKFTTCILKREKYIKRNISAWL